MDSKPKCGASSAVVRVPSCATVLLPKELGSLPCRGFNCTHEIMMIILQCWGSNLGPCACSASALPHRRALFWLFILRQDLVAQAAFELMYPRLILNSTFHHCLKSCWDYRSSIPGPVHMWGLRRRAMCTLAYLPVCPSG